jgi:hypothetical protein
MRHSVLIQSFLCIVLFSAGGLNSLSAQGRPPRHYLMTTFYLNTYGTGERDLKIEDDDRLDSLLGTYKYKQFNAGFYAPLFTRDYFNADSTRISNLHLLLTGNYVEARPLFTGLSTHKLYKLSLGFRVMYNNGKRNIWFFDINPFIANDNKNPDKPHWRQSSVILFNHTLKNDMWSVRVGITKTFLFGDRRYLPVFGFRYGRLDKTYVSFTFPRNISVTFPMGKSFTGSFFIKPQGGLYNFANTDTLSDGSKILYNGNDSVIQFGRFEFLNGFRLDYMPNKNFGFFLAMGVTKYNKIAFFSFQNNPGTLSTLQPFLTEKFKDNAGFLNFGITVRFGKTKKIAGNYNMYELLYLNNSFDPGDNNDGPVNNDIPRQKKEKNLKLQYKDIQEFIEEKDLY